MDSGVGFRLADSAVPYHWLFSICGGTAHCVGDVGFGGHAAAFVESLYENKECVFGRIDVAFVTAFVFDECEPVHLSCCQ